MRIVPVQSGAISSEHTWNLEKELEIYYVPKIALGARDEGENIHCAPYINPFP
jgi:hypothetical protein